MGITGVKAYIIKMPSSPTVIFVGFNVRLIDPKPLLKIECRAYILLFTITTLLQIFLTSYCTSKFIFKNYKILADAKTFTTNDAIAFSNFPVRIEQWG